ncbi:MAG: hypothetical protein JO362_07945 [Streptomycetaceae bacterium]|nr:hypothetical protein [Streptomycetaceae bacterium]
MDVFKRGRRSPVGAGLPPLFIPAVAVAGCHGGSGATTVTRLLAPSAHEIRLDQMHVGAVPLVLVCRGTAYGTAQATTAVGGAHHNITHGFLARPPVLVVVADSPLSEPPTARARLKLLQDRVQVIVRLPFVPLWRDVDNPLNVTAPRNVVDALATLRTVLSAPVPNPGVSA